MQRHLMLIDIRDIGPEIINSINTYYTDFIEKFCKDGPNIIDMDELFDYSISYSLSGLLGINLTSDFLHTEIYNAFYHQYLEPVCLTLIMSKIKNNNLGFLSHVKKVKILITYYEIIFVYFKD